MFTFNLVKCRRTLTWLGSGKDESKKDALAWLPPLPKSLRSSRLALGSQFPSLRLACSRLAGSATPQPPLFLEGPMISPPLASPASGPCPIPHAALHSAGWRRGQGLGFRGRELTPAFFSWRRGPHSSYKSHSSKSHFLVEVFPHLTSDTAGTTNGNPQSSSSQGPWFGLIFNLF